MADELDANLRDRVAAATKIASSLIPLIGGPLGEAIVERIPRLRQDRIVTYLRQLNERIETLEKERVEHILADVEKIDLIETGGHLAARATTSKRLAQITEVVFRGLCAEQTDFVRRKRILRLLGEVDDDEILLLNAYGQSYAHGMGSGAWDAIDRPAPAHIGYSPEEMDRDKLYELGNQHLLQLGLLERKFDNVKQGEYPPFDAQSGGFKSRLQVSHLGRMLLKEAGIDLPSGGHN